MPLADSGSAALSAVGPLVGVLVGGGIAYYGQSRLEGRREKRELDVKRENQELRQRELTIQAYADAWSVRAEVDHRTTYARGWVGNEIALESLRGVTAPMDTWRSTRTVFADVLPPAEWLALVKSIELFSAEWDHFLAVARRQGPLSVEEKRTLLDELESGSKGLISRQSQVQSALEPVFELGEAAERAQMVEAEAGKAAD